MWLNHVHKRLGRSLLGLAVSSVLATLVGGCSAPPSAPASANRSYAFWPQPPIEPRIQFVRAFAFSTDVSPQEQSKFDEMVFGSEAERAVQINKPYGIAMRDGKIYVCDIRNLCVTILDLPKRQTRLVGVSGLNRFQNPVDLAVADDGMLYVADKLRGIMVFDQAERYVNVFGHEKFQPIGVAVHGDRLYVCNMAAQNIEIMDRRTGTTLGTIGTVGDSDGQFRLPLGIEVDRDGNLHVVDVMRCRLQKFTPDGKLLAAVGEATDSAGNFVRPKHVAVDSDGLVYVVDAAFQNVQVFDADYKLLTSFGSAGSHPGSMSLPAGICVLESDLNTFADEIHPYFEPKRLILVSNQFGVNKVSVYAMGSLRAGRTPQDLAATIATVPAGESKPGEGNPLSGLDSLPLPDPPPPQAPPPPPE